MSRRGRVARPRIAITLGDPRGIGPEVTRKALQRLRTDTETEFLLIGASQSLLSNYPSESVGDWNGASDAAGRVAGASIVRGVELALRGEVDALVTAPIDKGALHAGGFFYPGHTEMLKDLTGASEVSMLLVSERTLSGGPLRVVLATTHVALRDVPGLLNTALLVRQARVTADGLKRWWNLPRPRLAFCAFNPHASDGGLFGDEEERVIAPAVQAVVSEGIDARGPIPADTVFRRAINGEFDVVIAPYHDVGMAAFKTVSFGSGVNVTLGLPFPRTSPDHGTALDIAGMDIADPSSMVEAIRLASALVRGQAGATAA